MEGTFFFTGLGIIGLLIVAAFIYTIITEVKR